MSCLLCSAVMAWAQQLTTIDRPGFSLQYPASWQVATYQNDYNPDKLFTIDTDGQSTITIEVFESIDGINSDDLLFNAISVLDGPLVDTYSRSDMSQWGDLQGRGKHLKGKVMAMFPGGARIFFAQRNGKGVMITEIYYSEDLDTVMPGFETIGRSFEFK